MGLKLVRLFGKLHYKSAEIHRKLHFRGAILFRCAIEL